MAKLVFHNVDSGWTYSTRMCSPSHRGETSHSGRVAPTHLCHVSGGLRQCEPGPARDWFTSHVAPCVAAGRLARPGLNLPHHLWHILPMSNPKCTYICTYGCMLQMHVQMHVLDAGSVV